jgi:hypothetical protein
MTWASQRELTRPCSPSGVWRRSRPGADIGPHACGAGCGEQRQAGAQPDVTGYWKLGVADFDEEASSVDQAGT